MAVLINSAAAPSNGSRPFKTEDASPTPLRPLRPTASRSLERISCLSLGGASDSVDSGQSTTAPRRAERRSKAQALSAMGSRGDSASSATLPSPPHAARHATRQVRRMPPLPPLVFDTSTDIKASALGSARPIATGASTPRHEPPRTTPRAFGLEEAPTFYPTWDEFQDPLQYIQWTASPQGGNGVAYGIVKIVPPEGWHMAFVADESTFRFRTRVQRLNELSAEGRVSKNYREQLVQFHAQQGHGRVHVPQLAHRPVDLHALKQAVPQPPPSSTDTAAWAALASSLGYDVEQNTRAPSVLASAYERLIQPFEAFRADLRAASSPPPPSDPAAHDTCTACAQSDPAVVCTECHAAYHLACVQPPLHHAPRSAWLCPPCLVATGGDFGFEDGETHSLYSFWQRCGAFERVWAAHAAQRSDDDAALWARFSELPLRERDDLIEREFWRLVQAQDVCVDVEYGADIHSTTHGHASPTLESEPRDPYARSGWNLHNLPILPGSLLRYIRSDISGMTVPWIYIGMMFSAFCWHNEDHYTYSINYQHMGATKSWYGVPGADAEAFEAAMQRVAPELFAADPTLLLQLVTMMSPALALREGVRMYACHQHPNEFVVTFPKAYHSGLNHGFNVNEAVNFALPDWIMDDLACVRRYQQHARQPVFSHDELLVTIALHNQQLSTAMWLQHALQEMVERELAGRTAIRTRIAAMWPNHSTDEVWDAATEVACAHCKTLCYLSHVVCDGDARAACLAHADQVHGNARWTLRVRHTDAFLTTQQARVAERAAVPIAWQQRVRRFLEQHPRPPLRMLHTLVQEGEKIAVPLPELPQLRAFLARAEPWVARAQAFLPKRHAKSARRGVRRTTPPLPNDVDRTPDALLALQARVPTLPFEAPELQAIDGVVDQMRAFCHDADAFLGRDAESREAAALVDEAERTLGQGELLHLDLAPVQRLRTWIAHVRWFAEVHRIGSGFLTLEEVEELLAEGAQGGVPPMHPLVQALEARATRGRAWSERAQSLLDSAPQLTRAALAELLDVATDVATPSEVRARAHALEHKAAQWEETMAHLYQHTHPSRALPGPDAPAVPPHLEEARHVLAEVRAARVDVPYASELEAAIALHDRWDAELAQILQAVLPPDEPVAEAVRALCERTVRAAQAEALYQGCRDEPTYESVWTYPPVPYPPPRAACDDAPCLCFVSLDRAATVACATCYTVYHLRCLGRKAKPPRGWQCAFCDDAQFPSWLRARRGVSQLPLVALLQNPAYQPDQFRFLPSNYVRLQAAVRATVEFGVAACMQFRSGALPASLLEPGAPSSVLGPPSPQLKHLARRALGCPIDILLIADATPQSHIPSILDVCGSAFHVPPRAPAPKKRAPKHARPEEGAAPSRKRARRARFQFAEEARLVDASDLYCYCRAPDNGTMVQCDRCSHWFHSACMGIDDPQALQDKWYCPVCSFRLRIKYPWAEIKIRDGTRPHEGPPDVFVDVTASLKSQTQPVLKRQPWISGKRLVLTLSHFEPAVPASPSESPAPAPAPAPAPQDALPALPMSADERHRVGRANLLRRGVSEAMMQAYSVGWNGESIVCHIAPDCHILLGPHIALARDDPDGTHLLRMAMDGLVPWARRVPEPTPTPLPPPPPPPRVAVMPSPVPRPVPTPPIASCPP